MRRLSWLLVVAVVLLFATGGSARADGGGTTNVQLNPPDRVVLPSDPQGAIDRARGRVAAGDLDGAIAGLETYVSGHPGEIGPERLLGDLYYRRGALANAERTYQHILSYAPKDKETHSRLGSVYATDNRINDAIAEFNRSLPGTDSVPDLVRLHLRKGDFDQYKAERQQAAKDNPTDPEAQLELGQVYEAIHQPVLALQYFERTLDNDPNSLLALNYLGLAYLDEHNYDSAIDSFNTCLRRDGYNYACADNLGAAYLESGRLSLASAVLDQAHHLAPERSEALVNLGYLADVNGDWKKAIALYVQAMTVYPYSPDAYIDLGYTYNVHGLYQLAQAALVKGLAVAPFDGRLHFLLGDAYEHEGNQDLAQQQYLQAASAQDEDPDVQRLAAQRVATLQRVRPRATP
ncbi:MAG TPA: tetratricopeptide repeat protein [Candidatus Baltobacteraceae bacterium]